MGKSNRWILPSYIFVFFLLFIYSFTQVDLGLTLTRASFWQGIQKAFQYIGYFNRPLSTSLYLLILIVLFGLYLYVLRLIQKNQLKSKLFWKIVVIGTIVLGLSYNAFSYDLFNYIFDARIFTFYHQNPYQHVALDYPGDPMLGFMHWTHRTFPYGPLWLVLTIPLSFIGFHLLLPTLILFKAIMAISFLGTCYFVYKIVAMFHPKRALLSCAVFALNPLVLIESLVSAHIDIVMMFFAVWSLYLFVNKQKVGSLISLLISIGIKFATVLLLPIYLFLFRKKLTEASFDYMMSASTLFMLAGVILASWRTTFQPWYLLLALPFASMVANRYHIVVPIIIVSAIALLEYVPYLWNGNWNPPIPQQLEMMNILAIGISVCAVLLFNLKKRYGRH